MNNREITILFTIYLALLLGVIWFSINPAFADENTAAETTAITPVTDFATAVAALNQRSFKKKGQAIRDLATIKNPRTVPVLEAMLGNDLYLNKQSQQVVIGTRKDGSYAITDAVSGEKLGAVKKSSLKKIIVNNRLRRLLRASIAQLSLSDSNPAVRLKSVEAMISKISDESVALLRGALTKETDTDVKQAMQTGIALKDIQSDDKQLRLKAIATLSQSLYPEAHNSIKALTVKNDDGTYRETDTEVRQAAAKALQRVEDKLANYHLLETVFFGLSLGSVLLLAAIGLAITFGVMGVINMAHGELMMLGAYTTYLIQAALPNYIEVSLFIAIPAAFMVSGLFGIAIERGVIRFLYGRPLETLLATFGISLILQQLVRVGISAQNVPVETPQWMSGTWQINNALGLTYNRLYIVIFSLLVFAGLLMILKKTRLGLEVRAVSQNRAMAKAMGIRTEWVDALTFGLGSGIAGVAGVALSQLTNVGPNLGQSYIIDSFMVVVFGGVGNLWGTLVGALSLGVANKFLEPWSGAVLAKIFVLVFIILFIQKKPRGLFPQKGRAAEH
jgi:urea transport system permease protein